MRKVTGVVAAALALVGGAALMAQQQPAQSGAADVLPWAYPINPPNAGGGRGGGGGAAQPAADEVVTVPGSSLSLRRSEISFASGPPDWHPDGHPAMPELVTRGDGADVRACGYCHLPNGQGRPENAGIAGQPAAYIVQQMADFRNGLRASAEPRMGPPAAMGRIGAAANDAQAREAAAYFSSIPFKPWIRVVEADMVPVTRPQGGMLVVVEDAGMEPIGNRIIETPEDLERTELRDDASGFIAYVPTGAIARGREIAMTGGARSVACVNCHGADLRGLGPVPALAGRSPSYVVRQLYDLQTGTRHGEWSPLMRAAVENLTVEDMVNIAAYTASREP